MSRLERLFGRKGGPPAGSDEKPRLELAPLCEALTRRRPALERRDVEPALLRARLADFQRDYGLEPLPPPTFDMLCEPLDAEAWRRLALVTSVLEEGAVGTAVAALARMQGVEPQVREGFTSFARQARLLTLELLGQSPLRMEELARRWASALGAGFQGETEEESAQRLARLDYAKLLEEAERAKQAAEARQGKLKKLREAQDAKMANRGKW
ncbi:hypothetical protein JY651_43175 [Pyxidicoccus parkwayensis]|uniref:Uncharacterized protein n=1 Tax=Pyxidicoccus parkwayensis TaxID=2813578 RepID=A0ABX7NTR9_9BACT|nr:hypothetical protein [Pyxidicoccus parkwaysis]QSQ21883.1 hypothetical protein JY651_43175 [Pyxidicoccus parkwaysis]